MSVRSGFAAQLFGLVGALALLSGPETAHGLTPAGAAKSAKDYQPGAELVTHEGKTVRFYDDLVKGRVVIINMMFTSCASICPPMTANLVKAQKILQERLGPRLGKEVLMLSVTVDPETDTPKVLKAYVERYKIGPGWLFLTGQRATIDALLAKLGSTDPDKDRHSGMLMIGNDAARTWRKVFAMSDPADIAAAVEKMLALSTPAGPAAAPAPAPPRP